MDAAFSLAVLPSQEDEVQRALCWTEPGECTPMADPWTRAQSQQMITSPPGSAPAADAVANFVTTGMDSPGLSSLVSVASPSSIQAHSVQDTVSSPAQGPKRRRLLKKTAPAVAGDMLVAPAVPDPMDRNSQLAAHQNGGSGGTGCKILGFPVLSKNVYASPIRNLSMCW